MEIIGEGSEGFIYKYGERAAKVLHGSFTANPNHLNFIRERLANEYEIAKELYRNNISVPIPFGIFDIPFKNGKIYPAFLMQFIKGKNLGELRNPNNSTLYYRIEKLAEIEIEKAKGIGFRTYDANRKTNIIVSKYGKIYLIDFGLWFKD